MAEAPKSSVDVGEQCKEGPDFFSFYAHEIANLLSEDEDILCNPNASELSQGKFGVANGKGAMDCIRKDAASLFENSIGATLSDFKKGRLRVLLRQSANDLSKEVDEMLGPVLSMCQLKHNLENNILPSSESERKDAKVANNKAKMSSSSSSNSITGNCSPMNASSCEEMDEDVQFLLKNADKKEVKEIIKKYSDDLSAKLLHMEQKLEDTLNIIMSKCRPMTVNEKRRLQKLIQKLPQNNLARVVEIIQRGRPAGNPRGKEIFVNLEKEPNVTLWRLYYYVEAVEKAKILARSQCS